MDSTIASWEQQLAAIWDSFDNEAEAPFLAAIDAHLAELPTGSAIVAYEVAASRDSTGHPDLAVPFYRYALDIGLEGERRRRAVIQLASSLRNLGSADEAVALLEAEHNEDSDYLADELTAFLALCLADVGREREAAGLALSTLAPYLSRYQRSLRAYAREIVGATDADDDLVESDAVSPPQTAPADAENSEATGDSADSAADDDAPEQGDAEAENAEPSDPTNADAGTDTDVDVNTDTGTDTSAETESTEAESGSDGPDQNETGQGNSNEWSEGDLAQPESSAENDTDRPAENAADGDEGDAEPQSDRPEEWTEPASGADSVRINRD